MKGYIGSMAMQEFKNMLGRTFTQVTGAEKGSDRLCFHADNGATFTFYHDQDCCESVTIEDIAGDVADLLGLPLAVAEEVSNEGAPAPESELGYAPYSYTWTFYKFATARGSVTVRWLGESNGYYSESVDYEEDLRAEF